MATATFRFYEELNDFLPKHRRKVDFEAEFKGERSVKDMVESLGVEHAQIDLILTNGKSVGFGYILQDGDRVSVYPVFECFNITNITRLRKVPLRKTGFIAGKNLKAVANCMRLLGFDVYLDPALPEREIIEISNREKPILLTKNRKLLKSGDVDRGIFVGPGTVTWQVKKIIQHLDLCDGQSGGSDCCSSFKSTDYQNLRLIISEKISEPL